MKNLITTLALAGSLVFGIENSYSQKVADYSHKITNQTLVIDLEINKSKEQRRSAIRINNLDIKNYPTFLTFDDNHSKNRLRFIFYDKNQPLDTLEVCHPLYPNIEIFSEKDSIKRTNSTLEETNYKMCFPYRKEFNNIKIEEILNNKKVNKEYFFLER